MAGQFKMENEKDLARPSSVLRNLRRLVENPSTVLNVNDVVVVVVIVVVATACYCYCCGSCRC